MTKAEKILAGLTVSILALILGVAALITLKVDSNRANGDNSAFTTTMPQLPLAEVDRAAAFRRAADVLISKGLPGLDSASRSVQRVAAGSGTLQPGDSLLEALKASPPARQAGPTSKNSIRNSKTYQANAFDPPTPRTLDTIEKLTSQTFDPARPTAGALARKYVTALRLDADGSIWVGTQENGVQCLSANGTTTPECRNFTIADGLAENAVTALEIDSVGRVWVGHRSRGISVYTRGQDKQWQIYEGVAGVTNSASRSGPLGERIFDIVRCPTAREIWIATNAGLSRYAEDTKTWRYWSKNDGLPSDDIASIAFCPDGRVIIGTACDGLAYSSQADNYMSWTREVAKQETPIRSSGRGLPCNLINKIATTTTGLVVVATASGLACHQGDNTDAPWVYICGKDWYSKKISAVLPPSDGEAAAKYGASQLLGEDYCTFALPIAGTRQVLIGHRQCRTDVFSEELGARPIGPDLKNFATCAVLLPNGQICVGTHGAGIVSLPSPSVAGSRSLNSAYVQTISNTPPTSAEPLTVDQLETYHASMLRAATRDSATNGGTVACLADDWITQGSWVGRIGRYWSCLSAMDSPRDLQWGSSENPIKYQVKARTGENKKDYLRYWIENLYDDQNSSLEMPPIYLDSRLQKGLVKPGLTRRPSYWDDHGEEYLPTSRGFGLFVNLQIPQGQHVVSFYESNVDEHRRVMNTTRDYLVKVVRRPEGSFIKDQNGFDNAQEVARFRAKDFRGGVYKRILVTGPASYDVFFDRCFSRNTILSGIMVDVMDEFPPPYPCPAGHDGKPINIGLPSTREVSSVDKVGSAFSNEELRINNLMRRPQVAIEDRQFFRLFARFLLLRRMRMQGNTQADLRIASALYRAGYFEAWERELKRAGIRQSREVELGLKWDGRHNTAPGDGFDLIRRAVEQR